MSVQLKVTDVQVNIAQEQGVRTLLDDVNLVLNQGDFVTVLGTNGAGKSTLFNAIAGTLPITAGQIEIAGHDVTKLNPEKRAKYIARVFQDPKLGTAPRMTVAENLALASHRGDRLKLKFQQVNKQRDAYRILAAKTGNGLDQALDKATEQLSGGQRQALSLLMASLKRPELLLLDEHTAALDPHTSQAIMALTAQIVAEQQLTGLMITHQMDDALQYGNRLIVLDNGRIIADYDAESKAKLTRQDLLDYFD
ncbi:ABC transporter ATP-binding protein [Lacticaseibacillus saniviri]